MKERKFFDIHDLFKSTPKYVMIGGRGYGKTYKEKNRLNAIYGKRICEQVCDNMFTVKEFKDRLAKALYAEFFPQMKVSVEVIDYSLCMYNVEVEFFYKGWQNSVNRTCNGLTLCSLYNVYDYLINDIEENLKECDEEWEQNTES